MRYLARTHGLLVGSLHERTTEKDCKMHFTPTTEMAADIFTKFSPTNKRMIWENVRKNINVLTLAEFEEMVGNEGSGHALARNAKPAAFTAAQDDSMEAAEEKKPPARIAETAVVTTTATLLRMLTTSQTVRTRILTMTGRHTTTIIDEGPTNDASAPTGCSTGNCC